MSDYIDDHPELVNLYGYLFWATSVQRNRIYEWLDGETGHQEYTVLQAKTELMFSYIISKVDPKYFDEWLERYHRLKESTVATWHKMFLKVKAWCEANLETGDEP